LKCILQIISVTNDSTKLIIFVLTGLQYHIIAITTGYLAAQVIKKYVDQYYTEGDSRLRDYIIRHPELFPEPRKTIFLKLFLKKNNERLVEVYQIKD